MRSRSDLVLFGTTGMLGRMVAAVAAPLIGLKTVPRRVNGGFDVEDSDARLRDLLLQTPGALVVNAIAMLSGSMRPEDPASMARAIAVNSCFPHRLAAEAAMAGLRVIQISTDAVFPPNSGTVDEASPPCPADVYGLTKLLGELSTPNSLTIRCSIVGPNPGRSGGLWAWLLSRSEGDAIEGYTDQEWVGCTTHQLAMLCLALAKPAAFDRVRAQGPVHHFAPSPRLTKYELLRHLRDRLRPDITLSPVASGRPVRRRLVSKYNALESLIPSKDWNAEIGEAASINLLPILR